MRLVTEAMKQERVEAVWRERARRLAQVPALAGTGENSTPVIVLGVGKEQYGIDLTDVAQVLPPVRVTPVPGAAAVFAGVVNVHGEIRPVMDLRPLLGIAPEPQSHLACVVLLRQDERRMGLRIDRVERVRWIGAGDLQPSGNGGAGTSPFIKANPSRLRPGDAFHGAHRNRRVSGNGAAAGSQWLGAAHLSGD
jgi:purine-binding chemotaxis protein CheW